MHDVEARDAIALVEVDLPNGTKVAGRTIPWRVGMTIKVLISEFIAAGDQKTFDKMFETFSKATGISERDIFAADPNVTLLELVDLISRFIYRLRPGRTAARSDAETPAPPQPSRRRKRGRSG